MPTGVWTLESPATVPGARAYHAMFYFPDDSGVILFGGEDSVPTLLADTWKWNGTTWAVQSPVASPAARKGHCMAYDGTSKLYLFGGNTGSRSNQLYEYTGATWTLQSPATTTPSARDFAAMAGHTDIYSVARLLMWGGDTGGSFDDDVYEWYSGDWHAITPEETPEARWKHSSCLAGRASSMGGLSMTYGSGSTSTGMSSATVRRSRTCVLHTWRRLTIRTAGRPWWSPSRSTLTGPS